jgi:hypothetical protein
LPYYKSRLRVGAQTAFVFLCGWRRILVADIYEVSDIADKAWRAVEALRAQNPLGSEREVRVTAGTICEGIAKLFRVSRVCIFTQDPQDLNFIRIWVNEGLGGDQVATYDRFKLTEDSRNPIGCVVRTWLEGRAEVYTTKHKDFINTRGNGAPRPYKESLQVPLAAGPRTPTVCVVCVDAPRKDYFNRDQDSFLLRNMTREPILHIMRLSPQLKHFVSEHE